VSLVYGGVNADHHTNVDEQHWYDRRDTDAYTLRRISKETSLEYTLLIALLRLPSLVAKRVISFIRAYCRKTIGWIFGWIWLGNITQSNPV